MEHEFEMPTPCQHCGDIFDLNDGIGSEKWYPNTVICKKCSEKELQEIELDEIIEDANLDLNNALFTFNEHRAWDRLSEENRALIIQHVSVSVLQKAHLHLNEYSEALIGNIVMPSKPDEMLKESILVKDVAEKLIKHSR